MTGQAITPRRARRFAAIAVLILTLTACGAPGIPGLPEVGGSGGSGPSSGPSSGPAGGSSGFPPLPGKKSGALSEAATGTASTDSGATVSLTFLLGSPVTLASVTDPLAQVCAASVAQYGGGALALPIEVTASASAAVASLEVRFTPVGIVMDGGQVTDSGTPVQLWASGQGGAARCEVSNADIYESGAMTFTDLAPGAKQTGEIWMIDPSGASAGDPTGSGSVIHRALFSPVTLVGGLVAQQQITSIAHPVRCQDVAGFSDYFPADAAGAEAAGCQAA